MEAETSLWDDDLDEPAILIDNHSVEKLRRIASENCVLCQADPEDEADV